MSEKPKQQIRIGKTTATILALLIIAPWLLWWRLAPDADIAAPIASVSAPPQRIQQPAIPPWGTLIRSEILIEPPIEFVSADFIGARQPRWIFHQCSEEHFAQLWQSLQLPPAQLSYALDRSHFEAKGDTIVFKPTAEFVLSLTPTDRARVYGLLSDSKDNILQFDPYRIHATIADRWFEGTQIPFEAQQITRKLSYQRGTSICFSDPFIVLPLLPSGELRAQYVKALYRKLGVLVALKISPEENIEPLCEYWGTSGRSKDIRPLLESLARRPNGGTIDIVHLLPPFARNRVYTYPKPTEVHDCNWTSLNFWNIEPDERLVDARTDEETLLGDYYPVPGPPAFGDIVTIIVEGKGAIHTCIYLADDIVFTKNGISPAAPWLLAPLDDVKAFYSDSRAVEIRRYRRKKP